MVRSWEREQMKNYTQVYVKNSFEAAKMYCRTFGQKLHASLKRRIFVGAGGISFFRVMPTYHNPTGWKAYIMNMYTVPEYRRKGVAYHTLELLTEEAKKRNISFISLEATDMGRPLYERYGFVKMNDEMILC